MPKPLIYAHRGSSIGYPENTRAAFMAAIDQGSHGIECDLRLSKDGQIIIWHDSDMFSIAKNRAKIAETEYSEIKNIYPEVMLLVDLIEIALANKVALALETKHPVPTGNLIESKIIEFIAPITEINISLLSFSWLAIEKTCREAPNVETVALLNLINTPIMERFSGAKSVAPTISAIRGNPKLVAKYKNEGKRVFVWTVNEIEDLELCAELAVDVVITDLPAQAVSVLGYP
jgi:glycerophosphoryl diester phosphodiesterase